MKRRVWVTAVVVLFVSSMICYYYQTHITVWGFHLSKKDIKDVIVQTDDHSFIIDDKKTVLSIAEMVSSFEKSRKIEPTHFPPQTIPRKYVKILIRTKNNATYGGSLFVTATNAIQDCNGFYWRLNYKKVSTTLDKDLVQAHMIN